MALDFTVFLLSHGTHLLRNCTFAYQFLNLVSSCVDLAVWVVYLIRISLSFERLNYSNLIRMDARLIHLIPVIGFCGGNRATPNFNPVDRWIDGVHSLKARFMHKSISEFSCTCGVHTSELAGRESKGCTFLSNVLIYSQMTPINKLT